jgi:hypothetical protein
MRLFKLTSVLVQLMIVPVVRLKHSALQDSSPTAFSGIILYFVEDWIGIVVNVVLCGELLSCSTYHNDIDLTDILFKSSSLLGYMPCISDQEKY